MVHDQNIGIYPIIDNDGCDNGERNWIFLCRFFMADTPPGTKKGIWFYERLDRLIRQIHTVHITYIYIHNIHRYIYYVNYLLCIQIL